MACTSEAILCEMLDRNVNRSWEQKFRQDALQQF